MTDTTTRYRVKAAQFKHMVATAVATAAKDESRPVLAGVLCVLDADLRDAAELRMVSADGYRLSDQLVSIDATDADCFTAILPAVDLARVVKTITKADDNVEIIPSKAEDWVFRTLRTTTTVRQVGGTFPDWRKIAIAFPTPTFVIAFNPEMLKQELATCTSNIAFLHLREDLVDTKAEKDGTAPRTWKEMRQQSPIFISWHDRDNDPSVQARVVQMPMIALNEHLPGEPGDADWLRRGEETVEPFAPAEFDDEDGSVALENVEDQLRAEGITANVRVPVNREEYRVRFTPDDGRSLSVEGPNPIPGTWEALGPGGVLWSRHVENHDTSDGAHAEAQAFMREVRKIGLTAE